ncbi:dihydrorhizobitoxine desaturase [Pseudomonas chlororaphis]|uniref:fatty acid desaturase family protein n=1 Tax=Pseudomonas chlororaphis TaxID=587753 RepID=UPI000F495C40|nr:fatty acid desaturase [Pseudomonas chlororaphis]ROL75837.1 dihydrorhizobitoxine desaturase [Pseudomonas chlororaphis]
MDTEHIVLLGLIAVSLLLRALVAFYYRDAQRVLRLLKLIPRLEGRREQYYRPLDTWFAPLPFVWTWLDIVAAVQAASIYSSPLAWLAVLLWSGGRMRALQEFGHNAVHFALCRHHAWQWWLSNVFYQFPMFKRDMRSRHQTHTLEHHRHPNHPQLDPNRARVHAGGYVAGLSPSGFYALLLYPLTPRGAWVNLTTLVRSSLLNHSRLTTLVRCLSVAAVAALLYAFGGWKGVLFGWLLPLLTSYPVFAWISLLTEHRWFIEGSARNRRELEYLAGRPTDYFGVSGWLVRVFIAPTSDAYHLAHSLYPGVRWNYLPAIDRHLKIHEPRYSSNASEGLLLPRGNAPTALSELYERLVCTEHEPSPLKSRGSL